MAPSNKPVTITFVLLLISITFSNSAYTDISCLKAFKDSIEDPENALSSWDFSTNTTGYVCKFLGIVCWRPNENRILSIELANIGFKGMLPVALANCTSITRLNLSGNHLFGNLPNNISKMLPFVTSLDLSSNNFTGQIPRDLANCSYLNILELDNNRFSGRIPKRLARLDRIRVFSVANNSLYGQVPIFKNANISAESYAGNPGLCGGPLPRCEGPLNKTST